ncbi:MAG: S-layer homology domain-containing protein [Butyricicoccus sp.]|nr:S-layer homology domain-containing protein [Butyricicoccus sp.]
MAFTMMATAGAAYTDQADIEATEAVDLLNALSVMTGDPDGAFRPNDTITRAEACRMIYTIRNGGKEDASAYANMQTTFTDVPNDAWYAGYVKHCQSVGIVSGKSATVFDPNSNVTGVELALMCLRVMGYDPAKADIGGSTWSTKTIGYATEAGLLEDFNAVVTDDCPRQYAAQLMANMLEASVVRWSNDSETYTDKGEDNTPNETVGAKYMNLAIDTGVITGAPSSKTNPKGVRFNGQDYGSVYFRDAQNDVSNLFGYEVKVAWNTKKVNDDDAIYGIYLTDDNTSYETTWADVEQDGAKVKFGGQSYELDGAIDVYADHWVYDNNNQWTSSAFNNKNLSDAITFIDNDGDGKIEAAQIKTQDVTKVTYVGSTSIDTNGLVTADLEGDSASTARTGTNAYLGVYATNGTLTAYDSDPDLKDVTVYEGIAKNDYAKVTYDYFNDKVTYEKIDAVEAKVEATRTSRTGTKEIRIDGTWYEPAAGYAMPSIVSGDTVSYIALGNLLYNVEKTDGTWGSKSLALVYQVEKYEAGTKANELEISLITRDGTKKTAFLDKYNNIEVTVGTTPGTNWVIDEDNSGAIETSNGNSDNENEADIDDVQALLIGKLLTYRESGNEISLMPVSTTQKAGYDDVYETAANTTAYTHSNNTLSVDKVNGNVISGGGTRNIADNAVVFVYTGSDADVLTGKELDNASGSVTYSTIASQFALGGEENGVKYIQAAAIGVSAMPTTTGSNYAYVLNASETTDGDDYRYFELWTSNGLLEAYEQTSDMYTYDGGEIVTYEVVSTADGKTIVKDVDPVAGQVMGAITSDGLYGTNSNKIAIDGRAFDMASDYTLLNVNTDKKEGIEGDAAAGARAAKSGTYNILYIPNGKGEVEFALVDGQNNEIKTVETLSGTSYTNTRLGFDKTNYVVLSGANVSITDALNLVAGKSLTAKGNLTLASGTIAGDVVVKGNLTLSGSTTVTGTLKVEGTINDVTKLAGTGSVTYKGITNTADATKAAPQITKVEVSESAYNSTSGTVTLTFSKELDASTVAKTDFTFSSGVTAESVSVNGKTVVITTGTASIADTYTLTVATVSDYAGVAITTTNDKVTFGATYNATHAIGNSI